MTAYYPSRRFPSVSVTGSRCQLGCAHCDGHYLEGMLSAESPDDLRILASEMVERGCIGFLLSGGCDRNGRIPLRPFAPVIAEIKRNTGLQVSVHPGLLDEDEASDLVEAGVDVFCIDMVQDQKVINDVLGLKVTPQTYEDSLASLFRAGAKRVIPHITIGLNGDGSSGEIAAIDMVSRYNISSLAMLSFIQTPGTKMASSPIASDEHFVKVLEYAVKKVRCPVMLGCMRPRGNPDLELRCFEAGVTGIAVPSSETIKCLEQAGIIVKRKEVCCSFL